MFTDWLRTVFAPRAPVQYADPVDLDEATCAFIGAFRAVDDGDQDGMMNYLNQYEVDDLLAGGLRVAVDVAAEFADCHGAALRIVGDATLEELDLDCVRYGVVLHRLIEQSYAAEGECSPEAAHRAVSEVARITTGEEPSEANVVAMAVRIVVYACRALWIAEIEEADDAEEPKDSEATVSEQLGRAHQSALTAISTRT